jgi:hypothetical protein
MYARHTELELRELDEKYACIHGVAWRENFAKLRKWLDGNGGKYPENTSTTLVRWSNAEFMLYQWAAKQRERSGFHLALWKRRELEGLIDWCWDEQEQIWRNQWRALKTWLANGNAYPSRVGGRTGEAKLARWANEQRRQFKSGKLSEQREELMYEVPDWAWSDAAAPWMPTFKKYKQWVDALPHDRQYQQFDELSHAARRHGCHEKRKLLAWLKSMFDAYTREKGGRLSELQKRLMDELPCFQHMWPNRLDMTWEQSFAVLQEWGRRHDGLPRGPFECSLDEDERPVEYCSSEYGWVPVGNFLDWSCTAMRAPRKRFTRKTRLYGPFDQILNDEQRPTLQSWLNSRSASDGEAVADGDEEGSAESAKINDNSDDEETRV